MYFDDYRKYKDAKLDLLLFWDMDRTQFQPENAPEIVTQRVIERGVESDWYALFNMFGINNVIKIIKDLPYLNKSDMSFVSLLLDIPLNELKCYERKQSLPQLWIS